MPEKFEEMTRRWDEATVDEIPSKYREPDTRAYEVQLQLLRHSPFWAPNLCLVFIIQYICSLYLGNSHLFSIEGIFNLSDELRPKIKNNTSTTVYKVLFII